MNYFIREMAYFLIGIKHRLVSDHLKMEYGAKAANNAVFEGYNKLSRYSHFSGKLGYGSYVGEYSRVSGEIGRFCSIAGSVTFLPHTHPSTGFVSSHPCFYSQKKQSGFTFVESQKFEETPKLEGTDLSFKVGNDVYIGHGATIIGPVVIGDGAVIAANATVTGDVEPYTVVAGTPARAVKRRFSEEDIAFLTELKWWDRDLEWIRRHADDFGSVEALRKALAEDAPGGAGL